MDRCAIGEARDQFHKNLIGSKVLALAGGVPTNADRGSSPSKMIALAMCRMLGAPSIRAKLDGQTAGRLFEEFTAKFLEDTFPLLQDLRPGQWLINRLGNQSSIKNSYFAQYKHLASLENLLKQDPMLATSIGNDYVVAPDIVIGRMPCSDALINKNRAMVDDTVALFSELRERNNANPILHASISVKWTMRSDRAQNSRTEALNLIRNRKGHLPHIVVVTAEPLPLRLASLAMGTGDIDCLYHFALPELMAAVGEYAENGHEETKAILDVLTKEKRLKDISDLPLDLAE